MTTSTEKLIKALSKSTTCKEGDVLTNVNGIKYRYDEYRTCYKFTPYWLKVIFNNAAKENGKEFSQQFNDDNHSFYFDRAKFKNQRDGAISYNKLVVLG